VTTLIFVADFVPRVLAGLRALGLPDVPEPDGWDHDTDPIDLLLNRFAPTVGALRALDAVTTEVVRLRGAAAHNCRLCRSLREGAALDAGGTESMYADIEHYDTSTLLDERHTAALRYVDALIWTPSRIDADVAAGVRAHFTDVEATELTLDVMRNAANKIAVALAADAPRVAEGTERYLLGEVGHDRIRRRDVVDRQRRQREGGCARLAHLRVDRSEAARRQGDEAAQQVIRRVGHEPDYCAWLTDDM
jgi:alkylhydroperoxidase family enzyme